MSVDRSRPPLRRPFAQANPAAYGRAQGRAQMVAQLRTIDEKTAAVRERMRTHCKRFEETWVVKEAAELWQERAAWAEKHKAPARAALQAMAPNDMMALARRNVKARIGQRLTNINRIGERMRATITSALKPALPERSPELRQTFRKSQRRRME